MIQTKNLEFLHIRYPNLKIEKGEVTFLIGPSGVGKSTLFKLMNQTVSPTNGTLIYSDDFSTNDPVQLRQEISLVSQDVFLFDDTIKNNFLRFYNLRKQENLREEQIKQYLSICQLDLPLDKPTSLMSGGERQRLYLALFLSFRPKVILLDEPTSALDVATGVKVLNQVIMFAKKQDMTVVIISHDPKLVEHFHESVIDLGVK